MISTLKLSKTVFALFCKGNYSKRKAFAPLGSKFFPIRVVLFSGGITGVQESLQKSHKLSLLSKTERKSIKYINSALIKQTETYYTVQVTGKVCWSTRKMHDDAKRRLIFACKSTSKTLMRHWQVSRICLALMHKMAQPHVRQ